MTNYIGATCFRTAFRISLDNYRELMNFFSLNADGFEKRYLLAVKDRTLFTNISEEENEHCEIIFYNKTQQIPLKFIQNLAKMHSDVISADNVQKLTNQNPNIINEFELYINSTEEEKKLFWSSKNNFETGRSFLFLEKNVLVEQK